MTITLIQPKKGESEFRRRTMRACEKCRFFSDLQARIGRGKLPEIEAVCLNENSIHAGKWKRPDNACFSYIPGKPLDLPVEERA